MELDFSVFFNVLSYIGVISFAISGAIVAIDEETDVFGVVFLSFITAFGGGLLRDIILNEGLPHFFVDYGGLIIACFVTSLAVFFFAMIFKRRFVEDENLLDRINNYIDAVGIAVFSVSGAKIAIEMGYDTPFIAIFMGVTTCIGGGILRDIIVGGVPFVLRKRIYALACLAGSSVYYLLWYLQVPDDAAMLIGALVTFTVRVLATIFRWNMPKAIKFSELRKEKSEKQ
ncbi:MAG: trimeric intracellular cation channel family protein [Clostridia bacterium]|nr:trimeric intracellular cation channel family protein [Clostridia bacterium]